MWITTSSMKIFVAIPFIFFSLCTIAGKKITPEEYISRYKEDAVKEMNRSGVPASITLAQGMLESGYGNSELARKANNHFGIKCHSKWKGPIYRIDDDQKDECFRKYKTVWHSYRDHSDFLRRSKRYAFLFELKMTDYKGWCRGLKKAGYATNPKYASLLIKMIERYDLNQYVSQKRRKKSKRRFKDIQPKIKEEIDNRSHARLEEEGDDDFEIHIGPSVPEVKTSKNWIKYIEVKKGDTYYSIAKKNALPINRLYRYNECNSDTVLKIGTNIYLQPKRSKGSSKHHVFQKGDDLYRISQEYGIKLKDIYRRNNWSIDHVPQIGDKIYLRGKRRV